jgi:hypothetical protein
VIGQQLAGVYGAEAISEAERSINACIERIRNHHYVRAKRGRLAEGIITYLIF